jgi:hypothetical protein
MKTTAEYQKLSRQRILEKNGYKIVSFFVDDKTSKRLDELVIKNKTAKRYVLNFIKMS